MVKFTFQVTLHAALHIKCHLRNYVITVHGNTPNATHTHTQTHTLYVGKFDDNARITFSDDVCLCYCGYCDDGMGV